MKDQIKKGTVNSNSNFYSEKTNNHVIKLNFDQVSPNNDHIKQNGFFSSKNSTSRKFDFIGDIEKGFEEKIINVSNIEEYEENKVKDDNIKINRQEDSSQRINPLIIRKSIRQARPNLAISLDENCINKVKMY